MRIYAKPASKVEQRLLDVLHVYGIKPLLQSDRQGSFYDVTPPDYWQANRRKVFQAALEQCMRA